MAPNIYLVVLDFDDENYLALIAIFRDCVLCAELLIYLQASLNKSQPNSNPSLINTGGQWSADL